MRTWVVAGICLTLAGCTLTNPQPTPAPPTATSIRQSLAVYYTLAEQGKAPRLVREFHQSAVQDNSPSAKVRAAVTELLTRKALDPDYASLWPANARVANIAVQGETAIVDLTGAAVNSVGAQAAQIAVQQLVWTATAVQGVSSVTILLDGRPANEIWGHVAIDKPIRRAPAVDVLARVWLISPQHGDKTGRDVTLHIAGIAFEATVNYEVRRGTTLIKEGFVTLNDGAPNQGETKATLTLEPGEYVLAAFLISSDDGSRQAEDNHTIMVS